MRTTAWETALEMALRNCSKEEAGEGQYMCDVGEGDQSSTYFFAEGFC